MPTNMADHKNKEGVGITDESQNIDAIDDFDPFSVDVNCVYENINIALWAPAENQWVFRI